MTNDSTIERDFQKNDRHNLAPFVKLRTGMSLIYKTCHNVFIILFEICLKFLNNLDEEVQRKIR
jgi:hypothetical protein